MAFVIFIPRHGFFKSQVYQDTDKIRSQVKQKSQKRWLYYFFEVSCLFYFDNTASARQWLEV